MRGLVLLTALLVFDACSTRNRSYADIESLADECSTRIVSDRYIGGHPVQVTIRGYAFNRATGIYRIEARLGWTNQKQNYWVDGIMVVGRDPSHDKWLETDMSENLKNRIDLESDIPIQEKEP
ncbi:MAG: hypothetical protein QNK37_01805 [Acidobacteriota bacterium]|nr:hypothetical protein [Acidobacteriota bacterium]